MESKETTRRLQRMNKRVQQALGEAILRATNNPIFRVVSITSVETSKDYKNAKVLFSCFDESIAEDVKIALSKSESFFRQKITEAVDLPYTPRLKFVYDSTLAQSQKVLAIMDSVKKEREATDDEPDNDDEDE